MEPQHPQQQHDVIVVAVPFPAQGHLNQLLHLSSLSIPVHFCTSATHNRQAKSRIQGWSPTALQNIHFHDLPIPSFPTPPPNPSHNFPSHLIPSFNASLNLQTPLSSLLLSLSPTARRLVVLHDPIMSFAGRLASSLPNAESFTFHCIPAFYNLSALFDRDRNLLINKNPSQQVLDVLLPPLDHCFSPEFFEFVGRVDFNVPGETGVLFNTCRVMESEFLDLLASVPPFSDKKLFLAIGPVNPIDRVKGGIGQRQHECLEWLDKQQPGSVVFISFGSTSTISDEQIEQMAIGLQGSKQRFIWVLRDADRGDIFAELDETECRFTKLTHGFEKLVEEGVGMVVRGWSPQLEILAHRSTGAFVSHCGWNSCMESLSLGVPIIAWPMHSDQPRNAVMVTEYLKTGVAVREWARYKEVVPASQIEESIRRVMVRDEGKEIRKRAELLGEAIRGAKLEGGSSRADLDSFVARITRR